MVHALLAVSEGFAIARLSLAGGVSSFACASLENLATLLMDCYFRFGSRSESLPQALLTASSRFRM